MADGQAKKQIIYDPEEFAIRKRLPPSLPRRNIDVYITNKTAFKAQLERCHNFIEKSEPEFYIHSLGSGIPRALNLALKVQKDHSQTVSIESVTSTVELTDDFEPFRRDLPEQQRNRHNTAIHIKVTYSTEALKSLSVIFPPPGSAHEQ